MNTNNNSSGNYGHNPRYMQGQFPRSNFRSHHHHSPNNNNTNNNEDPLAVPANHSDRNLYVRHLPLTMDDTSLHAMFAKYGQVVSSAIMRNIHTGESLGTAFVRFESHEGALLAMSAYHHKMVSADGAVSSDSADESPNSNSNNNKQHSTTLTVLWAKKHHDEAIYGEARKKIRKLFVRNIPLDVTEEEVSALLRRYGEVDQVTLHADTAARFENSTSSLSATPAGNADDRQIAFITFHHEGTAAEACDGVHNTFPFASCGSIPVMAKLAEDNRQRHARRVGGGSSNNNNSSNPMMGGSPGRSNNNNNNTYNSSKSHMMSSFNDSITTVSTNFRTPQSTPMYMSHMLNTTGGMSEASLSLPSGGGAPLCDDIMSASMVNDSLLMLPPPALRLVDCPPDHHQHAAAAAAAAADYGGSCSSMHMMGYPSANDSATSGRYHQQQQMPMRPFLATAARDRYNNEDSTMGASMSNNSTAYNNNNNSSTHRPPFHNHNFHFINGSVTNNNNSNSSHNNNNNSGNGPRRHSPTIIAVRHCQQYYDGYESTFPSCINAPSLKAGFTGSDVVAAAAPMRASSSRASSEGSKGLRYRHNPYDIVSARETL